MKYVYAMLLAFVWATALYGQSGKLLLSGGGREDYGSWSDTPYGWAIEQAPTPTVAIIGYEGDGSWYAKYFTHLGADKAQFFLLDSPEKANDEVFIQELAHFDVFFFRGGDQYQYYRFLKNSRLSFLLQEKYSEGAVLAGTSAGMAILSGVIFTAAHGSLYPEQALHSLNQPEMTLADGLFPFYPGFIFDTHFIERGRFPRLLAFMAHWQQQTGEHLTGIGVDDKTALCIDAEGIATVYGSAGVHFYKNGTFNMQPDSWTARQVESSQLLHGMQYSLCENRVLSGPPETLNPRAVRNTRHQVLLSGHEEPQKNRTLISKLKNMLPSSAPLLLISPTDSSQAYTIKQYLQQESFSNISILQTSAANNGEQTAQAMDLLKAAELILFAQPSITQLRNFMEAGPAGELLQEIITYGAQPIVCWGPSSALAGSRLVSKLYQDPLLAYEGKLGFSRGLGLIEGAIIIPDAFNAEKASYYENVAAAIPLAMVKDSLRFGIFLQEETVMIFTPAPDTGEASLSSEGLSSNLILENPDSKASLPEASGNKRSTVAFQNFNLHILNNDTLLTGGWEDAPVPLPPTRLPSEAIQGMKIFPNPTSGLLWIESHAAGPLTLEIKDRLGRTLLSTYIKEGVPRTALRLEGLAEGWYILSVRLAGTPRFHHQKLIICP